MKCGGGKWGWRESWFWQSAAGTQVDCLLDSKSLVTARRAIMSTYFSVQSVSIEITDLQGNSSLLGGGQSAYGAAGCGPGSLAGPCANPWMALLLRCTTGPGKTQAELVASYARNVYLRGIPDAMVCMNADTTVPFLLPDALRTPLANLSAVLLGAAGTVPAGMPALKGAFQFRASSKATGKAISVAVHDVNVLASGKWQITTLGPIQVVGRPIPPADVGVQRDAAVGDVIHVKGPREPWASGFSRDHRIVDVTVSDPVTGFTVYTLSGKQCRACTVDYLGNAVAWGVNHVLVKPQTIDASRPVNKKTGKPFFTTRGRRRRC